MTKLLFTPHASRITMNSDMFWDDLNFRTTLIFALPLMKEVIMIDSLFVATKQGLLTCEQNGHGWREVERSLEGYMVTSVIAREGVILAGTTNGVYRSDNLGQTWREASQGLDIRHVRWLAYHPDISDAEFAGTEPAGIFVSRDGAETWRVCPEISKLRDINAWFLPYSRFAPLCLLNGWCCICTLLAGRDP